MQGVIPLNCSKSTQTLRLFSYHKQCLDDEDSDSEETEEASLIVDLPPFHALVTYVTFWKTGYTKEANSSHSLFQYASLTRQTGTNYNEK